ncbi:MAG: Na+/H+ antiporter NhaC [Prolixibacteraceae bacterium]|jgi:Na+:H+ antiporter, NhaC family|nr:Na+/H+ antiporter NhaC [Prolixibacteraceae bacterium]MBT6007386.1 Na+/H+ antiporter NhaC [Prolixibacteraceae bacterium]MBT6998601.1 Na+/H+ antiporter NhaC [Prolixibacteraceae bacterium]MBT7395938.1 Na+/H+ antiporter NhaC [Prolixibacteraceae bacterium]
MSKPNEKKVTFLQALLPVVFLFAIIIYGLVLRPVFLLQEALPLEIVFLSASVFAITQLRILGFAWDEIQESIINKLKKALPTLFILFAIGLIIGSWIVSGTIPMLVYYGIKIINTDYIYVLAFFVPIIFSTVTGTSWGSIGTIGVVIMGIAITVNAHLGITAGAIIGGAYFGDKMSPLSDTTNIAALAVEVKLYDHIRSMTYTTVPSAIIALIAFFILGFIYPAENMPGATEQVDVTLNSISSIFNFSWFLLIPPAIILYGSIRKKATIPVLLTSTVIAVVLAFIFQGFKFSDVIQTIYKGFDTKMAFWIEEVPENINQLFNRGGLYELSEPIIISIMVFVYIGTIDKINAMTTIVGRVFRFAKKRSSVIISSLFSSSITNAMTSNQYATSFVVGDAFIKKYDKLKIPRKVLSRSLEDYGTMIESLVPWTTTTVFIVATLGVSYADYWHWQILSLTNIVVAPILAITGIGCFYKEKRDAKSK